MKRLYFGIIIFSFVAFFLFFLLSMLTNWPFEVILVISLASAAGAEILFYKMKRPELE